MTSLIRKLYIQIAKNNYSMVLLKFIKYVQSSPKPSQAVPSKLVSKKGPFLMLKEREELKWSPRPHKKKKYGKDSGLPTKRVENFM